MNRRVFIETATFGALAPNLLALSACNEYEKPALNLVPAGEIRDTTTPKAMTQTLLHIFNDHYLTEKSRSLLRGWMIDTKTGLKRIRAGLPDNWVAGDKTGTAIAPSMANKHNDIGVIWSPNGTPIVFAAYCEADGAYKNICPEDDLVLAEVGKIIATM